MPRDQIDRLQDLVTELHRRRERQRCEASLVDFLQAAWPHVGETGEFLDNWHHWAIAHELESLVRGEQPNLIINQPPRTTKSLMCSVAFPAWVWCQPEERWGPLMGPHVRFFCLSYGATLATDMAVKMRRLILGEWYQRHWGHQVKLRQDQSARDNFANTKGGERLSNSIEGGILGRGGDVQIIDDPHHLKGAESAQQRAETLEGMRSLVTRVTDPRHAARVLVMQRLHEDDATNYALDHWENPRHLMLPMRFDPRRADPKDERTEEGELLWPEMWTERHVQAEERELQEYGTAGQLQQTPIPRGGGIVKREWWRLWPEDYQEAVRADAIYHCASCGWHARMSDDRPHIECASCGEAARRHIAFPEFSYRLLSVDTAYGEKQGNSWSAATVWGIWHDKEDAPRAMLVDAWRGRPRLRGIPDSPNPSERIGLVERIYKLATVRQVDTVLIERKTRGTDLYNELERLISEWPFQLAYFDPVGSKEIRLEACVPLFANDRIWAPDKGWAETVIREVASQPKA